MLLTTALMTLTPGLSAALPPQQLGQRRITHLACLRRDTLDQECLEASASTGVFDFMTMENQNHTDGPMSHWDRGLAHTTVASASSVGAASATSQLLATAINITPPGTITYVPQVTANLYGRLTSANPDFSAANTAGWSIQAMNAVGGYRVVTTPSTPPGFATIKYLLYAYCVGQDPIGAFDPGGLTTISLNASNSTVFLTHMGPGAGWNLMAMLERSSASDPTALPEFINIAVPETFNQAWVGTQAVFVGPDGGGTHNVSFIVTDANAFMPMAPGAIDASERSIGGSASFQVYRP